MRPRGLAAGKSSVNLPGLGLGTCVKVCKFDAIHVKDGVAKVDRDKCTACGMCVKAMSEACDRAGSCGPRSGL